MTNAPTKKFRASVDDASFDVEVAADMIKVGDAQFVVSPRGQTIDVIPASDGGPPASAARAFVATAGDVTWVSIDGEVFTIDIEDAHRRTPASRRGGRRIESRRCRRR